MTDKASCDKCCRDAQCGASGACKMLDGTCVGMSPDPGCETRCP